MFAKGKNICLFKEEDEKRYKTTRWNLDELILYLDNTLQMITLDNNFPFDIEGECAAELDNNAREYDVDDENKMDEYYDKLNDWSYQHSWHHASCGEILPDVFFRKVNNGMKVSWWSDQKDEGITFKMFMDILLFQLHYIRALFVI